MSKKVEELEEILEEVILETCQVLFKRLKIDWIPPKSRREIIIGHALTKLRNVGKIGK